MDVGLLILFVVALMLGGVVLFFITRRGQGASLNVEKYRSQWLRIEQSLVRDNEASRHLAILNADKLLDQALKQSKYKGATMGERMKSAKNTWSNADHVWTAHKLRNRIAHESDVKISHEITVRALAAFKQALKDVRAI
ncbi:MAG TPA: hypothetical protein VGE34_01985 [Candidatus Saccharimonadales bacterium]